MPLLAALLVAGEMPFGALSSLPGRERGGKKKKKKRKERDHGWSAALTPGLPWTNRCPACPPNLTSAQRLSQKPHPRVSNYTSLTPPGPRDHLPLQFFSWVHCHLYCHCIVLPPVTRSGLDSEVMGENSCPWATSHRCRGCQSFLPGVAQGEGHHI